MSEEHLATSRFELGTGCRLNERAEGESADEEDVPKVAENGVALDVAEARDDVGDGRCEE